MGNMVEEMFPAVEYPGGSGRALNENGDLAGEASLNGSQMQAFIYTVEHGVTALPLLPGSSRRYVSAVRNRRLPEFCGMSKGENQK